MLQQMTLPGLFNATSSPVSESGPTPCAVPVGPITARCGPAPALALRSAPQARKSLARNAVAEHLYRMLSEQGFSDARIAATTGLRTDGISGRNFTGSSRSAALALSLANRLQDVTARLGATLFKQRWSWKAGHLASVRWIRHLRMACDDKSQMPDVEKAVRLLRAAGGPYREYWCYVLVKNDVDDAHERVLFLEGLGVTPFAQPYRDWKGTEPTFKQSKFARWCNCHPIRTTTPWPVFWEQCQQKAVANV